MSGNGNGKRDDELMSYLDGELSPRAARAVEDRIATSPEDRAKVAAIQELGDVMRGYVDAETKAAEPALAAMWAQLEGKLGVPEKAAAKAEAKPGVWAALREWFSEGYRGYAMTGAVCAAVAAIITIIAVKSQTPAVRVVEHEKIVYQPAPPQPDKAVVEAKATEAEIEKLDVSEGTGTVIKVPGNPGDADTTVIWVVRDQKAGPEGPI